MKKSFCLLLVMAFLLTGCGSAKKTQAAPTPTPAPAAAPTAEAAQPEETAAAEAPAVDAAAPEEEAEAPAMTPDGYVISPIGPGGITPDGTDAERGMTIQLERTTREAYDPVSGEERILTFTWDTVQVQSDVNPDAAAKITETMAAMEEEWYTGTDTEGDIFMFGYSAMLGAAEDHYNMAAEGSEMPVEYYSSRTVEALRADSEICVFNVHYDVYMAGAHGSYLNEAVSFDARTGERLSLASLGSDEAALKAQLVSEMTALVNEDAEGYYSERIDPSMINNDYQAAFTAMMRDGAWYPGEDGFHVASSIYELGPYAAGIVDFVIPYEKLAAVLDARWVPQAPAQTAELEFLSMEMVPEGSMEVVERVTVGEGGNSWLLFCQGEARNLSIWTGSYAESFIPLSQAFFCGSLRDAALQVTLEVPGDAPCAMLRYTDANGLNELLVSMSGEDGSLILTDLAGNAVAGADEGR